MRHLSKTPLLSTAAIAAAAGVFIFANGPVVAQSPAGSATYRATLSPTNPTSARGEAVLTQSGRTLKVHITATGLEPGGPHASHIHGLSDGSRSVESDCPTAAADTDDDGYVELAEGALSYGPIIVDFMNIDPDEDGNVDFTTTVSLSENSAATPLNKRHIVIHGMSVPAVGEGTPGEVNGEPGYKAFLPVLCGEIVNSANNKAMQFRTNGQR